ncbi:MAG TPA: HIT family protein [Ktedonobacterales bacterium]|nr:HIT family protein [Ktedonobacterales bacterium]
MAQYQPFDMTAYTDRARTGPCFICEMLAGNPNYQHHVIYENEIAVAFLNKYPTLYGYTLVAPKKHCEQVTGDFTLEEYLALQRFIFRVAEAIREVVPNERIYILSLGSQQGNRHVHWHVAPLPPGVPYEEQQMEALRLSRGVLTLSDEEKAALARNIRQALEMKGTL